MPRTTALAFLATLLLGATAQTVSVPPYTCPHGQFIVGGNANWALTGSTYDVAVSFMSDFCGASIGNTAVNCTGDALGSTRRVLQANSVYITEKLQSLTCEHVALAQVVISNDPDAYNEGTWTYYDYSHLSDIQVYHNHSTGALSMSMTTHKCVSNATMGQTSVAALLVKAQAYYISAIANATQAQ
ncbi:hypothetical protein C8R45DRAFT_1073576 [Mycena sanguinolenta]|nr:hypothetical protein C8R45DRAFT_1073576 [Mycena sanguinolenta]